MPNQLRLGLRTLAVCWLLALALVLLAGCGGGDEAEHNRCAELEQAVAQRTLPTPVSAELRAELQACGIRWGQQ